MFVVVKIGGCNGSGKTSLMRGLMTRTTPWVPIVERGKVRGYRYVSATTGPDMFVLGSYENVCGGMDTISDKLDRLALVGKYAKDGNIVFYEGLITGKTYGAMGAMSEQPKHKGKWLYTFLDTPFDVCVERVLARRAAKGNDAPFDPERTMRPTYKGVAAVALRAKAEGHKTCLIRHTHKPEKAAAGLLNVALEMYNAG